MKDKNTNVSKPEPCSVRQGQIASQLNCKADASEEDTRFKEKECVLLLMSRTYLPAADLLGGVR